MRGGEEDAYEDFIGEISKQEGEKILLEERDLTGRVWTTERDIAVLVRDVGLRTCKLVLQKTCDEKVAPKSARPKQSRYSLIVCIEHFQSYHSIKTEWQLGQGVESNHVSFYCF